MSIVSELEKIESSCGGSKITEVDARLLFESLPSGLVPSWLISVLQRFQLVGVCLSLTEDEDESELGVDLKWFGPSEIIEEALSVYPGKAVVGLGYLPVAACLTGSGDPYFLKMKNSNIEDPPLVRIPHDLVSDDGTYPESEIEIVCESLSQFFSKAQID